MAAITLLAKATFDSEESRNFCLDTLRAEQIAFNAASRVRFDIGKNNIVVMHNAFYRDFRNENPTIPAQLVIIAQRSVMAAYMSVKSNKHKITEPVVKKGLSLQLDDRVSTWLENGAFNMTAVGSKRIAVKPVLYKRLTEKLQTLERCPPRVFVKNGEIWIAYSFKVQEINAEGSVLGIDLGERNFAVTSEGVIIRDKNYLKNKRKIRFLKRALQGAKKRGSKSARKRLKRLSKREANMTKDFVNRVSNEILKTSASIIAIEDLRGIKRSRKESSPLKKTRGENRKNNRAGQVPYYLFRQNLTYKALLAGKRVETVSPYNTSQLDNRTCRKTGERKGRRYYGKDGTVLDADINAGINIASRCVNRSANHAPKRPILCCEALDGQVVVHDLFREQCRPANRRSS